MYTGEFDVVASQQFSNLPAEDSIENLHKYTKCVLGFISIQFLQKLLWHGVNV